MHTTRRAILATLKTLDQASVTDLADAVGVKAITIRHHLIAMLADGLIDQEEQRQALGRPLHVYCLSDKGRAMFKQDEVECPYYALGHNPEGCRISDLQK